MKQHAHSWKLFLLPIFIILFTGGILEINAKVQGFDKQVASRLVQMRIYEGEIVTVLFPNGKEHEIGLVVLRNEPGEDEVAFIVDGEISRSLKKYETHRLKDGNVLRVGSIFPGLATNSADVYFSAIKITIKKSVIS